jgi:hypothetical protein
MLGHLGGSRMVTEAYRNHMTTYRGEMAKDRSKGRMHCPQVPIIDFLSRQQIFRMHTLILLESIRPTALDNDFWVRYDTDSHLSKIEREPITSQRRMGHLLLLFQSAKAGMSHPAILRMNSNNLCLNHLPCKTHYHGIPLIHAGWPLQMLSLSSGSG